MDANTNIPEDPTTRPLAPHDPTASTADAPRDRKTLFRALGIAGASVLAAALLAGGGLAVGAAIAEADENDSNSSAAVDDDRDDEDDLTASDAAAAGTDSSEDLIEFMEAAESAADGAVVSIEMQRDGSAEVTLETEDGTETEVRVTAGGEASVISTEKPDADDVAPVTTLDAAAIKAIVTAALDEADGRVLEIEADDDASPYEVTLVTGAGEIREIDLDADFAVTGTSRG